MILIKLLEIVFQLSKRSTECTLLAVISRFQHIPFVLHSHTWQLKLSQTQIKNKVDSFLQIIPF